MNSINNNFFNNLPEHDCLISDRIALVWDSEEIISSLDQTKGSTTYEVEGPYGCIFAVIADNPAEAQELCVSIMGYDHEDYHIMGAFTKSVNGGKNMKNNIMENLYLVSVYKEYGYDGYYGEQYHGEEIYCLTLEKAMEIAKSKSKKGLTRLIVTVYEARFDSEGVLSENRDTILYKRDSQNEK